MLHFVFDKTLILNFQLIPLFGRSKTFKWCFLKFDPCVRWQSKWKHMRHTPPCTRVQHNWLSATMETKHHSLHQNIWIDLSKELWICFLWITSMVPCVKDSVGCGAVKPKQVPAGLLVEVGRGTCRTPPLIHLYTEKPGNLAQIVVCWVVLANVHKTFWRSCNMNFVWDL